MDVKKLQIEAAGLNLFILVALVFGFIFSLPCWIILIFAVRFISGQNMTPTRKKIFIIMIGVVLTFSLFYVVYFNDNFNKFNIRLASAYCLTIIAGIIFYKLVPDT